MYFNPDQWPSHNRGQATRDQIISCLSIPRTRAELAQLVGKSRKQIDRHLSRLASESMISVNESGLIVLRVSAGFLLCLLGLT